jgi:hypothetical protein
VSKDYIRGWLAVVMGDGGGTDLFRNWILDRRNETGNLVAHGLCSDASGSGLEINMTCTANTGIEGERE